MLVCALMLSDSCCSAQLAEPDGGGIERGVLPEHWATGGPNCLEMPEWQGHGGNPALYILRQPGCNGFEKPFCYLLFCRRPPVLLGTRTRKRKLTAQVATPIHRW